MLLRDAGVAPHAVCRTADDVTIYAWRRPSGRSERIWKRCDRNSALCADGTASGTPGLGRTGLTLPLLQNVNRAVNSRVLQHSDAQTYRVAELWTRPRRGRRGTGDCEDLALEKKACYLSWALSRQNSFLLLPIADKLAFTLCLSPGSMLGTMCSIARIRWSRYGAALIMRG